MASVDKDSKGWRIRFVDPSGTRKTIRVPGLNKSKAEAIGRHIDELASAKGSGQPIDRPTALWLSTIGQQLHDKLAAVGLVEARASATLKDFMAEYISDARTVDGKPAAANTLKKWRAAQSVLNDYFGVRNLRDITHEEAVKFRRWLDDGTLGENTKRTHIGVVKMFFNAAKRRKLVEENPFEFQKASLVIDRSRDFYLTRANAMKIIDACPDNQWRLIFALWRFAGLRKMEIFQLTWENVNWEHGRMMVTIPKTKHHEGKECRFVPIGDIRPWLENEFHAPSTSQRIITRYTGTNVNLAKPFEKIIERAGLRVWPKLIQNLRASCETDWLDRGIAAHVVAKWIGHSVKVQNDNYAQVDDHHFTQFNEAARLTRKAEAAQAICDSGPPEGHQQDATFEVAHQVAQNSRDHKRTDANHRDGKPEIRRENRVCSQSFASVQVNRVPEAGVEPARGITLTGF